MNRRLKKRRIKFLRVGILAGICLILVFGAFFGIKKLFFNDPYKDFDLYAKDTKKIGDMQHYTKTNDKYHHSFYYPKFDDETLNNIVKDFKEKNLSYDNKGEMYYTNIDYDSEELFQHYIVVSFHKTVKNKEEKILKEETTYLNYNKKTKKVLGIHDVLRRDYINLLKTLKSDVEQGQIKKENLNNFKIEKNQLSFLIGGKKIHVNYQDHASYIKLKDQAIPSMYQEELPNVKAQEVDPKKPMIAITFDDGPNPANTEMIMDEFDKVNGKATFFMLGNRAVQFPDIVKSVQKRGFELGNHSWDHSMRIAAKRKDFMSKAEVIDEIFHTQDVIYEACGEEPTLFRPPYGALNQNVRDVSTLDFALWNVDTNDWRSKDANIITNAVMQNAEDGAVVLLHDIYGTSAEAVKKFLPQLKAQGFQFVSLSTLMKYHGDTLTSENVVILSEAS